MLHRVSHDPGKEADASISKIHDLVDGGDGQPEEAQAGGTPEILANVLPAAPPKKRAQIHKPLVDRKIELTDEQLRDSRELYDREQARIVSEISAKKKDKASYFLAMDASQVSFQPANGRTDTTPCSW